MCSLCRPSERARARERVGRVVTEDELQPIVALRTLRVVVRLEAVDPRSGTRAGADADFEDRQLRRELALGVEFLQ